MPLNFIAKALVTVALTAAQMALTASQTFEGPRLNDLRATTANPGDVLPNGLGRARNSGLCFFAEPIKEKKKKHKTKGGKYKEYTYFGTWAVMVADHSIGRVRRIWFDNHLVWKNDEFGTTSVGDGSDTIENLTGSNVRLQDLIRIYTGTQTEPDPRMLAYLEAKRGADTCPAYLDVSYIFFEDVPLAKVGNRLPQVDIEYEDRLGDTEFAWAMDSDSVDTSAMDWDGLDAAYWDGAVDTDQSGHYTVGGNTSGFQPGWLSDLSSGTPELVYKVDWYNTDYFDDDLNEYFQFRPYTVDSEGTVWGQSGTRAGDVVSVDIDDPATPVVQFVWTDDAGQTVGFRVQQIFAFTMPDDTIRILVFPQGDSSNENPLYFLGTKGVAGLTTYNSGGSWYPNYAFQDDNGDIWVTMTQRTVGSGTSQVRFTRVTDFTGSSSYVTPQTITGLPEIDTTPATTVNVPHMYGFFKGGSFYGGWGGTASDIYSSVYLVKIPLDDSNTFTSVDITSTPVYLASSPTDQNKPYLTFDQERWFVVPVSNNRLFQEVSLTDLSFINSYDVDEWTLPNDQDERGYHWIDARGAFLYRQEYYSDIDEVVEQGELFLLTPGGTDALTLGDACRHFSGLVGLTENTDYTIAPALDAIPLTGYGWTQGPAKSHLDFLLPIHDCELRTHDGIPQFIARGGTVGDPIDVTDFVIPEGRPQERYKLPVGNEADLPRRIVFTYADTDSDLQPNTAPAQRTQTAFDGRSELKVDGTTLALDPDDAQAKIDRWFRRQHFTLQKSEQRLSARHLAIECGDLHPFVFDSVTITMHVDKITDSADGSRHLECSIDDPAIAALSGTSVGAPAAGRPPAEIFSPGQSTGFVLDIPLISDAHDQAAPFLYFAGGPVDPDATYVGTEISQSDTGDDDTYATWDAAGSSDPVTYGETTSTLADVDPSTLDNGSTLDVLLSNGSLSTVTEAQLLANGALNLAIVGDELIQFKTATLTAPLTYTLSGFVRGARGTEQHTGTHTSSDRFVLLDSSVARHTVGAGELGDTDYYIASAPGATPNPANEFAVDFDGNANRPYSPAHVTLTKSGSDWVMTGIRRTRIGGASLNGQDVPLGETSELWEMEILDGGDPVRTIQSTSLPITYGSAASTADFGSVPTTLTARLYQVSPSLSLRGFPTEVSA